MNNNKFQFEIETGIKALIFMLVLYFLPVHHGIVFWMSMGFTPLFFIVYIVGMYRVKRLKPQGRSSFYECEMEPMVKKFFKYQLIVCIVFTLVGKWVPIWLPMIAYVTLVGGVVVGFESDDVVKKDE